MNEIDLILPPFLDPDPSQTERVLEIEILTDAPLGDFPFTVKIVEGTAGVGVSADATVTVEATPPVILEVLGFDKPLRPNTDDITYRARIRNTTDEVQHCLFYQVVAGGGAARGQIDYAVPAGIGNTPFALKELTGNMIVNNVVDTVNIPPSDITTLTPLRSQYRLKVLELQPLGEAIIDTKAELGWGLQEMLETVSGEVLTGVVVAPTAWEEVPYDANGTYTAGQFYKQDGNAHFFGTFVATERTTTTPEANPNPLPASEVTIEVIPTARIIRRNKKHAFDVRIRNRATSARSVDVIVRPKGTPHGLVDTDNSALLYDALWKNATSSDPQNPFIPLAFALPAKPATEEYSEVVQTVEITIAGSAPLGVHDFQGVIIAASHPDGGEGRSATMQVNVAQNTDFVITSADVSLAQGTTTTMLTTIQNNSDEEQSFIVLQRAPAAETPRVDLLGNNPNITVTDPPDASFQPYRLRENGVPSAQVLRKWFYTVPAFTSVSITSDVQADFATGIDDYDVVTEVWQDVDLLDEPTWQPSIAATPYDAAIATYTAKITVTVGTPDASGTIVLEVDPNTLRIPRGQKRTTTVRVKNNGANEETVKLTVLPTGANADALFKKNPDSSFMLDADGRRIPLFKLRWVTP